VGFKPAISVSEVAKTHHNPDRAVIVIATEHIYFQTK
jgi:hypothetical protein